MDSEERWIEIGGPVDVEEGLAVLLRRARDLGASDVHLSAGEPPRARLVGRLRPLDPHAAPTDEVTMAQWVDSLIERKQRVAIREHGHADLSIQINGAGRMRVNACKHRRGHKLSFRLVDAQPRSLADLELPEDIAKLTKHHQGLGVVSGPSGHGKTTTLAALVDLINSTKPVHIITVEDPVEVVHPIRKAVISQREVGRHTRSFQAALKGALREDPDVIVIGELRDRETVEMALSAAETGHLVLATMSTPNGARTIDRLIELFPPEDQSQVRTTLAGALKLVISQRLVPSIDGTQRHPAVEMITGNIPLWSLIRDDKLFQLPSLLQRGRGYGMISAQSSLKELLEAGKIDRETAQEWADDKRAFEPEPEPEPDSEVSSVGRFGRRRR
jgi:twitching motility protein PilT